jgi:hypothetical protein
MKVIGSAGKGRKTKGEVRERKVRRGSTWEAGSDGASTHERPWGEGGGERERGIRNEPEYTCKSSFASSKWIRLQHADTPPVPPFGCTGHAGSDCTLSALRPALESHRSILEGAEQPIIRSNNNSQRQ